MENAEIVLLDAQRISHFKPETNTFELFISVKSKENQLAASQSIDCNEINPIWNEKFSLLIQDNSLTFTLFLHQKDNPDTPLASKTIQVDMLQKFTCYPIVLALQPTVENRQKPIIHFLLTLLPNQKPQQIIQGPLFRFDTQVVCHFDPNNVFQGIIHSILNNYQNEIDINSSSSNGPDVRSLIQYSLRHSWETNLEKSPYFIIDFNSIEVFITHYSIDSSRNHDWILEGSKQLFDDWIIIDERKKENHISKNSIACFEVKTPGRFRYLRLKSSEEGSSRLSMVHFEIYGTYYHIFG